MEMWQQWLLFAVVWVPCVVYNVWCILDVMSFNSGDPVRVYFGDWLVLIFSILIAPLCTVVFLLFDFGQWLDKSGYAEKIGDYFRTSRRLDPFALAIIWNQQRLKRKEDEKAIPKTEVADVGEDPCPDGVAVRLPPPSELRSEGQPEQGVLRSGVPNERG